MLGTSHPPLRYPVSFRYGYQIWVLAGTLLGLHLLHIIGETGQLVSLKNQYALYLMRYAF